MNAIKKKKKNPISFLCVLDGALRETLLLRQVQDHHKQHEGLHDEGGEKSDGLHVQRRLLESVGRNVSARHFPPSSVRRLNYNRIRHRSDNYTEAIKVLAASSANYAD